MVSETIDLLQSFNRLQAYTNIESEDELIKPQDKDLKEKKWPESGEIKFFHLSMKYREFLDPAINRINCDFLSGMNVAVIGQPGSGKSSIV
jgi:ABC-type multidrug transport system fused ATPase/permease subunit